MWFQRFIAGGSLLLSLAGLAAECRGASEFDEFLKPLFAGSCTKCHGDEKVKGNVDLKAIKTAEQFLAKPGLIEDLIEVIDANDMPPDDAPGLEAEDRTRLLATLKSMLRQSVPGDKVRQVPLSRLNRFQYNNSIKDLFQIQENVFSLPEMLMTRFGNYLDTESNQMPDKVNVACLSLKPRPGFRNVSAYPKDLRASHGFDNQANQLTLSPLLLDAFLKLSVSIIESPDFNEGTVGIWNTFFREPETDVDLRAEVTGRLAPFLSQAFRGSVDPATVGRYTDHAFTQMERGLTFTDSMKKVASAALSSPMFLYRHGFEDNEKASYQLASKLSFFLWSSAPDLELLRLAGSGELARPEVLRSTLDRMLADPRIERFLDTFPAQWMQLENVLAATPDPKKARFFSLDQTHPASTQMVLEPLLLFDAVFVENRPIIELIKPTFSYQSDFLRAWYTSDLEPPPVDGARIAEENRANEERGKTLEAHIQTSRTEVDTLLEPVRARLLAARQKIPGAEKPVDLQPYAAWEFDGDLADSVGSLALNAHGKIHYEDGMVVLRNNAYLQSRHLPIDLKAKTLEVWCKVYDVNQAGGGLMGIQGPGDFFDTIVLGERRARHWISGSNGFSRTNDFKDSTPEDEPNQKLHLAMVYDADGTTTLYRNGEPYGQPYRMGAATFPKDQTSVIFGLRHLPPAGGRHLSVGLARARLYDRALTADEVAASSGGSHYISSEELLLALAPEQQERWQTLRANLQQSEVALRNLPQAQDPGKAQQEANRNFENEVLRKMRSQTFERVAASDPRYGGVITNAALASMTSGPDRTHPIARGAWIIEVIFNDPPPPPPIDVPPLNEDSAAKDLTIREQFAEHRKNPDCAGCHSKLDPLGFALENFDLTGRWRDKYDNGRDVDASGTLMRKYDFDGIVEFKESLVRENRRFAKAFTAHLLRFALARELSPADSLAIEAIIDGTEEENFRLRSLLREIILSDAFRNSN